VEIVALLTELYCVCERYIKATGCLNTILVTIYQITWRHTQEDSNLQENIPFTL
jgi:hypothetical protein